MHSRIYIYRKYKYVAIISIYIVRRKNNCKPGEFVVSCINNYKMNYEGEKIFTKHT